MVTFRCQESLADKRRCHYRCPICRPEDPAGTVDTERRSLDVRRHSLSRGGRQVLDVATQDFSVRYHSSLLGSVLDALSLVLEDAEVLPSALHALILARQLESVAGRAKVLRYRDFVLALICTGLFLTHIAGVLS